MRSAGVTAEEMRALRRGWRIGRDDFADWLAGKVRGFGNRGARSRERIETDEALSQRLVLEALAKVRWKEMDLARQPKGHKTKVRIARELRAETPMSHEWIAKRLAMGSASYLSHLLADS